MEDKELEIILASERIDRLREDLKEIKKMLECHEGDNLRIHSDLISQTLSVDKRVLKLEFISRIIVFFTASTSVAVIGTLVSLVFK